MKGSPAAHSHAIIHLGGWSVPVLNLFSLAPHYLALAPWQCEACPTECFVSHPSGPFVPAAWCQTCFNPDTAPFTGEQSDGIKKASTNVLLYILSHHIADALSLSLPLHNHTSFKGAEHPQSAWQGAD